jgi:hypothetical protein
MLEFQVNNWNLFDEDVRAAVEIIVVDDHSSKPAAPILRHCNVPVRAYRVGYRVPWNMHQCRNIGAKEACTASENMWLFMSDIDIVVSPDMARKMLTKRLDGAKFYTMDRTFQTDATLHNVHRNTFLMKHAAFWKVNGYDLDLEPIGGGGYSGDTEFYGRVKEVVSREHWDDILLVDYSRRARDASGQEMMGPGSRMIEDAASDRTGREEWRRRYHEALRRKQASGNMGSVNPIRMPYTRVL